MTTKYPMPVLASPDLQTTVTDLGATETALVVGSVIDMAGVAHAKAVPTERIGSFHRTGIGAAPSWNVFCVDNHIALTPDLGVVGDMRLRADLTALHHLDSAVAWAPAEMFDQLGKPLQICPRGQLRRLQAEAEERDLAVLVGTEIEFELSNHASATSRWQAYGMGALFEHRALFLELEAAFRSAGLDAEQFHAEYGAGQYEVSFAPAAPLAAADTAVLARLIICEAARRHGARASFSPLPTPEAAGNGAHLHMSFQQNGSPLLSGGTEQHGLTKDGAAALAGIVSGLPEMLAVFAGSVLSTYRLQPGRWSGAYACWGLENREAAVRLCAATPGNPYGANIELKCVDTSANPYLACAAMLGLALDGIRSGTELPSEVTGDPATLPAGSVRSLSGTHTELLDRFDNSHLARAVLGNPVVDATVAVRRHEQTALGATDLTELCERLRYCWSS